MSLGRAAAKHFSEYADTIVYGISRRPIDGLEKVHAVSADLLNPDAISKEPGRESQGCGFGIRGPSFSEIIRSIDFG